MKYRRNATPQKGTARKISGKIYYYAGRTLYPSKARLVGRELKEQGMGVKLISDRERGTLIYTTRPSYPDLSEQFTSSYWNPKRRNPEMKKVYSNFPIIPTLLGSFLGFWIGNKVKPPTETASGGGGVGALLGAVGGFFVGRKIPTARIANPRKNPGAKWHEYRADHLRYLRSRLEPGSFANEVQGKINENSFAADASRRLGMNPKRRSWQEFVQKNLPELVRREGMTPQKAMKALSGWWKHYKKVGLRY